MYCHLLWILVLFLFRLSDQQSDNSKSLTSCLNQIGVFLGKVKVSLKYSPGFEDLADQLLKKLNVPIVINAKDNADIKNTELRVDNDLVIVFGTFNISRILSDTDWNSETRFVLLYDKEDAMSRDFSVFFNYRITNAFGIVEKENKSFFFGFVPFGGHTCNFSIHIVDECVSGELRNKAEILKNARRVKNLNGCVINVTVGNVNPGVIFKKKCGEEVTNDIGGFERLTIKVLARDMNFKLLYNCSTQGVGWILPTPGGAVGSLIKGESDFALGMLGPSVERFYFLDLSSHYNMDECISFGVPKGAGQKNHSVFYFLTFEFDEHTWALILFIYVLIFINFYLTGKFSNLKWINTNSEIIWELYASSMGLPIRVPNTSSQRFCLMCWIVFILIITVAYKSAMGSKLAVPDSNPDIDTFEELGNSKLQITGPQSMYRFLLLNDNKDPAIRQLVDRFVVTEYDIAQAVHLIATEKRIAFMRQRMAFLYNSLINPNATGQVHVAKKCLISYHPSVILRKNSFFTKRLNQIIRRLEEAGVADLWRSKYMDKRSDPPVPFVPISINRLYGLIWATAFGYGIGIFCFFLELWYGSLKKITSTLPKRKRGVRQIMVYSKAP